MGRNDYWEWGKGQGDPGCSPMAEKPSSVGSSTESIGIEDVWFPPAPPPSIDLTSETGVEPGKSPGNPAPVPQAVAPGAASTRNTSAHSGTKYVCVPGNGIVRVPARRRLVAIEKLAQAIIEE